MGSFGPESFFQVEEGPAKGLFEEIGYAWEAVATLPEYIEKIIRPELSGEIEDGAWVEPGCVQMEEGSRVERGAIVRGPAIIGKNSVIRSGAYIRGHVLLGDDCMIGHGSEVRQILVLNNSNIPHKNCIFTSIVGNRVNIGGHSSTANFRFDGKEITIRVTVDGERHAFPTGMTLFGAIFGDDSKLGGQVVVNPGTLIGKRCLIASHCTVSGYVPNDSLLRPKSDNLELISRVNPNAS